MPHANEGPVREAYAAFSAGDLDAMAALFAPDPIWHVPGRNRVSGDYRGVEAIFGYFGALDEATGGSYQVNDLHDVVANDEHAVSLHNSSAKRGEETVHFQEVLVFHFSDGKIAEVWENTNPSYEYDEIVGSG